MKTTTTTDVFELLESPRRSADFLIAALASVAFIGLLIVLVAVLT